MNGLLRPPHERMLPAWLGVSLAMHVVVLAGGGAILADRAQQRPERPATRVVLEGRIIESLPEPPTETMPAMAETLASPISPHSAPAHRRTIRDARTSAMGPTPGPATPPSQAVGGFADGNPAPAQRHSASAPRMGGAGAAVAGPPAGGGAEALTSEGGPVGFEIASARGGGGTGAGYGGSGSGLGVGGSSGGVGGSGTPGGSGLSSGGVGGGASGQIDPGGVVGGGGTPGPATGGASTGAAAQGGGGKSAPSHSPSAPAPRAAATRAPTPAPAPEAEPEPEPEPEPSAADLSAFRSMVQSRISGAKRYPSSARDAGQEGTVKVSFSVSPSGQPSGISVSSSSGYQSLDAAAQRAVSAAAPYRPFPRYLHSSIRVTATVIFRLN